MVNLFVSMHTNGDYVVEAPTSTNNTLQVLIGIRIN